jgi:nucleosome binding factor SPN SPT16 subunit
LSCRPALSRRKSTGVLEAHENGLRFHQARDGIQIDIIYGNIKHCFLQTAHNSIEVILHIELKNPIMCGKKKTSFMQFYIEVVAASQDLARGTRWHDADGLQEEQEERRRRKKYNNQFKHFANKLRETCEKYDYKNSFYIDVPYRQLQFNGVPNKESTMCIPTTHCLVALEDKPKPFVITLSEIDIVVLERVRFSLKNFDLTFVFKDYTKMPVTISTVPSNKLQSIKDWLNTSGNLFYESDVNRKWKDLLQYIIENKKEFISNGGWEDYFNANVVEEEGEEVDDGESDYQEEYGVSEDESEEFESDESEVSEESESDFQDDSEDEGADWSDHHKEAKASDRRRERDDDGGGRSAKRRRR